MRSEDDLRAAFTAKAGDAPAAESVLRAVRRPESRPPERRRWLAPVIGVAAAAAVGVPLALAISHSSTSSSKKEGAGNVPDTVTRGAPAAGSAGGAQGASSAADAKPSVQGPNPGAASLALCSPGDVSVSLRREGGAGTLLVTSRGPACRVARVPSVQWPSGSTTIGTQQDSGRDKPGPVNFGVLPAGGTASAAVQWTGCGLPAGTVVYVDWGRGPVAVHVAAAPSPGGCAKTPAPTESALRVSPLTGLS